MAKTQPFLWGASTSSHQVEGNNIHNDWWAWEKMTNGIERSGPACDHYNRYKEDFKLAKDLGHNVHRLSLEWSRIEPKEGHFNNRELQHYKEVLTELRRQGFKIFVTLHHFTNPVWLADKGGWKNRQTPKLFARYVSKVASELGDLVDFWITINEPMVYTTLSYWQKRWPPQKRSLKDVLKVTYLLSRAHCRAYRAIRRARPQAKIGIAKHLIAFRSLDDDSVLDKIMRAMEDWFFNRLFFNLTSGYHDFIGVNYYFPSNKKVSLFPPKLKDIPWSGPKSDMGWPIYPDGLTQVLMEMKRYGKPIYITENGLADSDDSRRADFIRSHLRAVEKAQVEGVDIRGYLHWSLMDNFEWAEGFKPRFGLVEVDFKTFERRPRASAYVYKAIIEQALKSL